MVTPRTHCHFMMQARALRVPELCDDHTPPSCLVTNSLAKPSYRSVNTLVLLTHCSHKEARSFPACALHQLFVRSCDLAQHGLCCSRVYVCTHHSSSQHLPFRCLLSLSFCAHMDERRCMRLPLGNTEWNHSYYTGNSLSALHSLQQLQACATSPSPVQMSASAREAHVAAPSSSVSCPQLTLCATHPQVQMDPTRTFTSDLLSATLAEAATQLSFAAVLERCIFVSASPPPRQQVSTPPLDAATQTFPHTAASRDVSTQLSFMESLGSPSTLDALSPACARPVPSLPLDAAVQTPEHSVPTHHASTQLPLTEFFLGCILSNDPLDRQALFSAHCNADSASPPQPPDIATLCSSSSSSSASHASDGHEHTTALRMSYHSRLRVSRSMPTCAPHIVYLLKRHQCDLVCVHLSQSRSHSHMSVPSKWEHILCAQPLPTREVQVPPLREPTILLVQSLVQELVLFLSREPLFFPLSNLGNPNLMGTVTFDTVDSDLMHHQYRLSVLQWNPGPARRHPTNSIAAACGKFHAVILQEASDHVPHISDQFIAHIGNTDLAFLLNKDTFEPDPTVLAFRRAPQAKVLGAWFYSSFEHCCDALHFLEHRQLHFALCTSTM